MDTRRPSDPHALAGGTGRSDGRSFPAGGAEAALGPLLALFRSLNRGLSLALDQADRNVYICEADATVVWSNAAARHDVEGPLQLNPNTQKLTAQRRGDTERLRASLATVCAAQETGAGEPVYFSVGGMDVMQRLVCLRPLVPRFGEGEADSRPQALVSALDPRAPRAALESSLKDLFGLTPAEAGLAAELLDGASLEDIADSKGVRLPTVRTHLRGVFRKTETNRQGELIALLARVLAL